MQTQVQVQSYNVQQTPAQEEPEVQRMKKILRGLGITEAIIGLICCVMGMLLMANVYGQPNYAYYSDYYYTGYSSNTSSSGTSLHKIFLFNLGEGLWAGVWIVVAGVLGAACGRQTVTPCLINAYLAFSIVASVFAFAMFGLNVTFALKYSPIFDRYPYGVGVESTLAFFSFTAFIICIVSACYCCCASVVITNIPSCCGTCCGSGVQPSGGYVVLGEGTSIGIQPVVHGSQMMVQGQTNAQSGATMYVNQPTMTTHQHPQVTVQQASPNHDVTQQSGQGAESPCWEEKHTPPPYQN